MHFRLNQTGRPTKNIINSKQTRPLQFNLKLNHLTYIMSIYNSKLLLNLIISNFLTRLLDGDIQKLKSQLDNDLIGERTQPAAPWAMQ